MENLIQENPKAFVTAFVAFALIMVRNFVSIEIIPESAYPYLDIIIGAGLLFLLGRYTRISKSQAEELK